MPRRPSSRAAAPPSARPRLASAARGNAGRGCRKTGIHSRARNYHSRMPLFSLGERRVELVGEHHYIAHDATLVGSITLHADANVWFQVVIRAENDRITIGAGSNIQDGSVLHVDPGYPMRLGRMVSVGHKVMLHGCTIGEGTLIGINSVIMNGAKIGRGTLIGANTLIPEGKEIPDGVLVLGSPGKIVRELKQEDRDYLLKIATGYVERSKLYKQQLKELPLPPSAR